MKEIKKASFDLGFLAGFFIATLIFSGVIIYLLAYYATQLNHLTNLLK